MPPTLPSQGGQEIDRAAARDPAGPGAGLPDRARPVPYNFRRPDKFSKDHIRSVQSIHEAFSRLAGNFLASKVRTAVRVGFAQVEQTTLAEFFDALPVPTALFVTALDPLVGQAIVQLDLEVGLVVIDRMLGGAGVAPQASRGTTLTEIEMLLLEDLGTGLFDEFVTAWAQVAELRPQGCEVALSPAQVQGPLPSEVALVVRHDLQVLGVPGQLTICLPASMLEPLTPRLNARLLFANPRNTVSNQDHAALAAQLAQVMLTVTAELGRVRLRVAELLSIEEGDVIRFDTSADSALPIRVEDRVCFLGQPGRRGSQLAIRIAEGLLDEPARPPARRGDGEDA